MSKQYVEKLRILYDDANHMLHWFNGTMDDYDHDVVLCGEFFHFDETYTFYREGEIPPENAVWCPKCKVLGETPVRQGTGSLPPPNTGR